MQCLALNISAWTFLNPSWYKRYLNNNHTSYSALHWTFFYMILRNTLNKRQESYSVVGVVGKFQRSSFTKSTFGLYWLPLMANGEW
jgi:hypothetical protein